jgi:hypothetical protein
MRTTSALRILTAALLTGSALTVTAGTSAAAAPPTHSAGRGDGHVRGTVVSRTPLHVHAEPTVHARVVGELAPGGHDRIVCKVRGQHVNGNPYWYWLKGAQGWASAAFVDSGRHHVPACADPCPVWKDGRWTVGFTISGTWSFTVTVTG